MKNSLFFMLIVLLSLGACKDAQKKVPAVQKEMETVNVDCLDNLPCMSCESIFPQTAWMWGNSWVSAYNFIYKNAKYPYDVSPGLHFQSDSLAKLKKSNVDANGVLLYYILKEATGTIPSLAMVNTVDCKPYDCQGDCVLVSWYEPKPSANEPNPTLTEFISDSLFSEYQKNWHVADSLAALGREGYIPVDGYNYSWKTLNGMSTKNGILVKYGARTIDASENIEFEEIIEIGKTGNIVACNVLVGWVPGQTFEEIVHRLGDNAEELDFAKPCPTFCN